MPRAKKSAAPAPQRAQGSTPEPQAATRGKRFDAAHEVARGDSTLDREANRADDGDTAENDNPNLGGATGTLPEVIRQFRLQARQLGSHLEQRQRRLDHREAQLNAQLAQHEVASRSARLWFQERHHELTQRATELEQRGRAAAPKEDERSPTGPHLAGQEFESSPGSAGDIEELSPYKLHELRQSMRARGQRLATAEDFLLRGQMDLETAWQQLNIERDELTRKSERDRREIQDERTLSESQLDQKRQAFAERAKGLELRSAALDQLRAEVLHIQRETLEMRLVTEEVWAQLSAKAPPAAVTQSMARLRAKLAEQRRLESAEINDQRREAQELTDRVAQERNRLAAERRDFDKRCQMQQAEIESQAAALVAREQQLDLERQNMTQHRLQWDAQRRDLEREIRNLNSELRRLEASVSPVELL